MMEEMVVEEREHRLVHLDLKGAPPKLAYYEQLFPMLRKWGATGLLVEYEDMFPYSGDLLDIAAPNAYSLLEIERLQSLAKQNDLIVVPLMQTFGHFEFVLKIDRFRYIREVEQCPMSLCPSHDDSFKVVSQMIDQIIVLHPDITWLHIGADEVFHIALCERCIARMKSTNTQSVDLFLAHVKQILDYIHAKYPALRVIMWDDMLRHIDIKTLKDSGIGDLVEPMVWWYQPVFEPLPDVWEVFSSVFGGRIWAASAYKGATGPCMTVTDINYHVENQKEWLRLVNTRVKPNAAHFRGYALTGWQRYDHYAVLCELLPVGLPSLAICLLTITSGAFTMDVHRNASNDLNFTDLIPMNPLASLETSVYGQFPGSDVYFAVLELLRLKLKYKRFIRNDRLKGWMTPWHVRNNYCNPAHVNHFLPDLQILSQGFEKLSSILETVLSEIFYPDTVEEWMSVNVQPVVVKLNALLETSTNQIAVGARIKNHKGQPSTCPM